MPQLTFTFPSEEIKAAFAEYLSDAGGEYAFMELLADRGLPPVTFGYHGPENEAFPKDDARRYGAFLCDDTIRVALAED